MSKGGQINYDDYAKSMRLALSGPEICKFDGSLNHQYFNAKKGFYWSEQNNDQLIHALCDHGTNWEKIATQSFKRQKTSVEVEMRACLLLNVKDSKNIGELEIEELKILRKTLKKHK